MGEIMGAFQQIALAETYVDRDGTIRVGDSFPICPSFGVVYYQSVDLGFPDVRASVQDLPQSSGTFDQTQYTGARALSIEGVVFSDSFGSTPSDQGWDPTIPWNSASYFVSLLSGWANPSRRYRLYFTDEEGRARYMDVRGDSFSAPIDKSSYAYRQFQLGMVNPSGRIYSFVSGTDASVDGRWLVPISLTNVELTGRTYALTEPRTYPALSGTGGRNEVYYGGTVPNGFTIRIYTGGSTLSGLRVSVTGPDGTVQSIGLVSTYAVPANTTVIIDTAARTVTQLEDTNPTAASIEQYLEAPLQWPQLRPGVNYAADSVKGRKPGYNAFTFTSSTGPSSTASINILYNQADLL